MKTVEEFLAHYGVKGMKWGVRNARGGSGSSRKEAKLAKADLAWKKRMQDGKVVRETFSKAYYDYQTTEGYKIASKTTDSEYNKRLVEGVNKRLSAETAKLGTNPSGTKELYLAMVSPSQLAVGTINVKTRKIEHSALPGLAAQIIDLETVFDDAGRIIDIRFPEIALDELKSSEAVEAFLAHYGVKGMKWGVRKSRVKKVGPSDDAKEAHRAFVKSKRSGVEALSNAELRALNDRLNLEQNYQRLAYQPGALERGSQMVKNFLGVGKQAHELYNFVNSDTNVKMAASFGSEKAKKRLLELEAEKIAQKTAKAAAKEAAKKALKG